MGNKGRMAWAHPRGRETAEFHRSLLGRHTRGSIKQVHPVDIPTTLPCKAWATIRRGPHQHSMDRNGETANVSDEW